MKLTEEQMKQAEKELDAAFEAAEDKEAFLLDLIDQAYGDKDDAER